MLLSRLEVDTSAGTTSLYMLVLGLGLGMVMQVLVLAVQNAVDYRHLGVATSGSTLFRQIGGSIGVAVFGAIFANRLRGDLAASLPPGAQVADGRRARRSSRTCRRRCTRRYVHAVRGCASAGVRRRGRSSRRSRSS